MEEKFSFDNNGELEKESDSQIIGDDDFVIGKGFVVDETPYYEDEEKPRRKRKKKRSVVKNIVWVLTILVVAFGIAFAVLYVGADYLGLGFGRGKNSVIEIEAGMSTKQISLELKESGAVKCPMVFQLYSKLKKYDGRFKYGVYNFNTEAGYEQLAEMLITEGAVAESIRVTIPEMADIDDIAKILEESGICERDDFINEVQNGEFDYDFIDEIPDKSVHYRLEGYLFPDTYQMYAYDSKECAHLAVDMMLKTLNEKITDEMWEKVEKSGYSFHEIMTMASIVELEAGGSKEEMANVAAVFFNRLKSDEFATLGSSPTRKYPYGNDRYNTYVSPGLPPGPLCSPSIKSVEGSLSPSENFDYYYFVTDASMKFYYNKTLAQHNNIIAKLKADKNWIYED